MAGPGQDMVATGRGASGLAAEGGCGCGARRVTGGGDRALSVAYGRVVGRAGEGGGLSYVAPWL